jgi:pimeloyl-ACP methyl ester carboxylesterase
MDHGTGRRGRNRQLMIRHRDIISNGIAVHIAECGQGPVVVLLHGAPETWYSWRGQLEALAAAGFHAVAPDLVGVGGTDAPAPVERYTMNCLVDDVAGLLDALSTDTAVLVGHDWGATIAYRCAQDLGSRVDAVIGLSVPYAPHPPEPPSTTIARAAEERFSVVEYFQRPGVAEAELEADPHRTFRLFLYALSGDAPDGVLEHFFTGKPPHERLLDGIPEPSLPLPWLSEADVAVYADAYAASGFTGILNRYRNLDRDWHERNPTEDTIRQPALYIGGARDSAVVFGDLEPMQRAVTDLRDTIVIPGCGHWVQQERAHVVTSRILQFCSALT